jgi:hypothetical protein
MPISRRDFMIGSGIGGARIARAQSLSRYNLEALIFSTTHTSFFHPIVTKSGKALNWAWGDGSYSLGTNSPTKTLAAGTKTFRMITLDGFSGVTQMDFDSQLMAGALPSLARCPNLQVLEFYANGFVGTVPSFQNNTKLQSLDLYNNLFSGIIPSFANLTLLTNLNVNNNSFTGVVAGSVATQKSLNYASFYKNALTQAAVDQILADFVTSQGISGRVTCQVDLSGGTNSTPSAAGLANKALLVAASWTVTNN